MIGTGGVFHDLKAGCARHRPSLLDMLEDPLGADLTPAPRGHLDTCALCRREMADVVLTGLAVRRALTEARDARPPADSWPRLHTRLTLSQPSRIPGRVSSPVLGLALAGGLAVAMLVPLGLPITNRHDLHEAGINPTAIKAAGNRDAEAEARQLRATILAGKEASSDDDNRARVKLIRQEAAPIAVPHAPPRSRLIASVR